MGVLKPSDCYICVHSYIFFASGSSIKCYEYVINKNINRIVRLNLFEGNIFIYKYSLPSLDNYPYYIPYARLAGWASYFHTSHFGGAGEDLEKRKYYTLLFE